MKRKITLILVLLLIFVVFYCIFFNFVYKSSTNEELEEFKRIAEEVYIQNDALIEAPSNIKIEKTPHYILVKEDLKNSYGYVKGVLKDGELTFEENSGKKDKISSCILLGGIVTFFLSFAIMSMISKTKSQV